MVVNGRVPRTSMTMMLNGQLLLNDKAKSVQTLVKVGKLLGTDIACPTGGDRGISGYRDLARQTLFKAASRGDRAAAIRCNMDPTMRTNMGAVGSQSHGWADRIDLLFDGHSPNTDDIALAERYSLDQEFGDDDRNHFRVLKSITLPVTTDVNRIVCTFLNAQHLGLQSDTAIDGKWPVKSKFSMMLQEYGSRQPGWYPQPQFKKDGEAGPRTAWVRNRIMTRLWAS